MLTISKKYLKDKIKKLIEENQIDLSDKKNQDARAVLIEQIKDMKDDSIITPNSIYNYAQQFLEKINKKIKNIGKT